MSCQRSLVAPMRRLLAPRPAIQAWRTARCFATQASENQTSQQLPPMPNDMQRPTGSVTKQQAAVLTQPLPNIPAEVEAQISALHDTPGPANRPTKRPIGVVVSAGKMAKTVKVRIPSQTWNKYLRKHYRSHTNHLVHDPNLSLQIGDVISIRPHRAAKHVHHIVHEILTPFGRPVADRPPVPSEAECRETYDAHRVAKLHRRELRQRAAKGDGAAIEELQAMGLHPGQGVEEGKGSAEEKRKGIVGKKGQKLPEGVLPGGKHAVGKINDRSRHNKGLTEKKNQKAEQNLGEALEKGALPS